MARKQRIRIPGGLYHVMLRGNGGDNIFFDDEDRLHFYLLLQEGVARFGHRIHGFCLMNNHVHLAIQVADESLSKIMQNISFRYARWINKKQQRVGHLFQGRYAQFVDDGIKEGHREEFHKGISDSRVLGDDLFIEQVIAKKKAKSKLEMTLPELSKHFCLLNHLDEKELLGPSRLRRMTALRSIFAWMANSLEIATLEELAIFLNRDSATLSRVVNRMKERRRTNEKEKLGWIN